MLETGLKQWLDCEESPSDFYQLVGQPRLCRDRDLLLNCFGEASEFFFQCQNHREKHVRDRARELSRQLADARRTLADETRWKQYDADIVARLHGMYRSNPNFSGPNSKLEDLKRWLALVQRVDSARVEELVASWIKESAQEKAASSSKPKTSSPEMETQSRAAGSTAELPTISERRDPPHNNRHRPGRSAEGSATSQLTSVSRSQEGVGDSQATRRPAPPPPPSRNEVRTLTERSMNSKTPPPPPPKELPSPRQAATMRPIRPNTPRVPTSPFPNKPTNPVPGSSALWIVMLGFVAAVVLGMFGLVIAWASGAFDGGRSRGDITREEPFFVLHPVPTFNPESPVARAGTGSDRGRDLFTRRSG